MENAFSGDIHSAIDEQLALFPGDTIEQVNRTEPAHFVPGTLNETLSSMDLTPAELSLVREEAKSSGITLPESDEDLQKLIRGYHAESLQND